MARKRPSAFEVSFPDEVKREEEERKRREEDLRERRRQEEMLMQRQQPQKSKKKGKEKEERRAERAVSSTPKEDRNKKRAIEGLDVDEEIILRPTKKPYSLPVDYYVTQPNELRESANQFLEGEDELFSDDDSDDEPIQPRASTPSANRVRVKEKPIRLLTDFTIFDTRHRNELVVLSVIEEDDGVDRVFEAAGLAVPYYAEEEEEDLGNLDEDTDDGSVRPVLMRIGPILRYSLDWTKDNDPFYIETRNAWYILKMPSSKYKPFYREFYTPRRIAQLLSSTAIRRPHLNIEPFIHGILNITMDIFGKNFEEEDLWNSVEIIRDAVEEVEAEYPDRQLRRTATILHILRHAPVIRPARKTSLSSRRTNLLRNHLRGPNTALQHRARALGLTSIHELGNPDLAVLKPENQIQTHVTPLIASLVQGFVMEELRVIGPKPQPVDATVTEQRRRRALANLWRLIERLKRGSLEVEWWKEDRMAPRSNYLQRVVVGGQEYKPGDFVLVPIMSYENKAPPELPAKVVHLPPSATIAHYFWFARIMYIKNEEQIAHVQWLEHASQTMLQELANPQELFLNNLCNPVPLGGLIAKVKVHVKPSGPIEHDEYFLRFFHDKNLGTFTSLDDSVPLTYPHIHSSTHRPIFDWCSSCLIMEEDNHKLTWESTKGNSGIIFGGKTYHASDFVLFRAEKGPAHIGQIIDLKFPARTTSRTTVHLRVKKFGRIWNLGTILPVEEIKDERHLFSTEEETTIPCTDIIDKCVAWTCESFDGRHSLLNWLSLSPQNFYIKYHFRSLSPSSWDQRTMVSYRDLAVCKTCTEEYLKKFHETREFLREIQAKPLKVLDLFGGVGAFSAGMASESECLKVTHAIELGPSAAKTFKRNSSNTEVINQCVNTVLKYAVKRRDGHTIERPVQLFDGTTPIPDVPEAGGVDVIVAGFPCQTHSTLNMFKTANDIKSNLMLNALSWVDFYRPRFVYVENVAGFLSFNLNAEQAGRHRLQGGITMGGLKLFIRCLLGMGYQVRYTLLQSGHYGTPQRRIRFFLIAAQDGDGTVLPEFPQPSHDFPQPTRLQINLTAGNSIRPIRTTEGTAPHPFVSIEDAIGDLPRFDWKRPGAVVGRREPSHLVREGERNQRAPAVACDHKQAYCGYEGRITYFCEPKTTYQKEARAYPTENLQHFTKTVKPKKVERVLAIPLTPKADYRSLRPDLYEWQFANPVSSVARKNYRPGLYGRLDKDSFFHTIVTNVDPTAKQSWVLHPYCKRMLTVRELARSQGFPDSFVFESIGKNVVTMHRQIGNAVSWPLARALGRELREVLFKEWCTRRMAGNSGNQDEDYDMEGLYN